MTCQPIKLIAACAAFAAIVFAAPVSAQTSTGDITRALQPKAPAAGLTRSLGVAPANPKAEAEKQFINRLRTRSISIEPVGAPTQQERVEIAAIAKDKPAIDLEILFDYNSDVVGPKAVPALVQLGNALAQAEFKGTVFLINGHTDAAGSPEYNQGLSQRRAQAVRRVLIEQYRIAPDTLIATGFGKEQLKVPHDPLSGANRRVQIVNTTVTAGR
jgi:outer membrane protein OmpA-like peptidoglycan-associated protein